VVPGARASVSEASDGVVPGNSGIFGLGRALSGSRDS